MYKLEMKGIYYIAISIIILVFVTIYVLNANFSNMPGLTRVGHTISRATAPFYCTATASGTSYVCSGMEVPYEDISGVSNCLKLGMTYEPWMKDIMLTINGSGKKGVAIDVGAHLGYHTRTFADHFNKVYSFEPDHSTFKYLLANTRDLPNVTCINAAVGMKKGMVAFTKHEMSSRSFIDDRVKVEDCSNDVHEKCVNMVKLDDVVSEDVAFVKIDVEGGEIGVIKGMNNIILKNKPSILFEDHTGDTIVYIKRKFPFYKIEEIAKANYLAYLPNLIVKN